MRLNGATSLFHLWVFSKHLDLRISFVSVLLDMYVCALYLSPLSALTIENKLTFLGFIFVFSKPVEKTWRRTQEVRPHSQAVNPPRWPSRPFLSPPPILLLLFSPSPFYLVPLGLQTPQLPNSPPPRLPLSLSPDSSPAWVGQTQALSKEPHIHFAGCCTQPCISREDMWAVSFYPFILIMF